MVTINNIQMNDIDTKRIFDYIEENITDFRENEPIPISSFLESFLFVREGLKHTKRNTADFMNMCNKMWNSISEDNLSNLDGAMAIEYIRSTYWLTEIIKSIPKDKLIMILGRDIVSEVSK